MRRPRLARAFLAACVAAGTGALASWAWSYVASDTVDVHHFGWGVAAAADRGSVAVVVRPRVATVIVDGRAVDVDHFGWGHARRAPDGRFHPFPYAGPGFAAFGFGAREVGEGVFVAVVPHWALAAITWVPPLIAWRRARRKTNDTADGTRACANCGYDLRATPGRCPECGAGEATKEVPA